LPFELCIRLKPSRNTANATKHKHTTTLGINCTCNILFHPSIGPPPPPKGINIRQGTNSFIEVGYCICCNNLFPQTLAYSLEKWLRNCLHKKQLTLDNFLPLYWTVLCKQNAARWTEIMNTHGAGSFLWKLSNSPQTSAFMPVLYVLIFPHQIQKAVVPQYSTVSTVMKCEAFCHHLEINHAPNCKRPYYWNTADVYVITGKIHICKRSSKRISFSLMILHFPLQFGRYHVHPFPLFTHAYLPFPFFNS
jgi:hypothetical protein